jgi:peroxiredoxin
LGVALGFAGVAGYFLVVFRLGAWPPRVRNDAVPSWIVVAAGLALSGLAIVRATRGRRLLPGVLLGLNVTVAGTFAVLLYVVLAVPGVVGPSVGAVAPDFALADQTGQTVRRDDFKGGPLLLVFYRGHWGPFCVSELQGLQLRLDEIRARGAAIAGVVVDPVTTNAKLAQDAGLTYPILSDPELGVIDAYGLRHVAAHDGQSRSRPRC